MLFRPATPLAVGTPMRDACGMADHDHSLAWRVAAVIGSTCVRALGFLLSVMKPPEQMNAQTMLPPEHFPPRRDEYRP